MVSEQNVYTDVQMEILRHIEKHGALPYGVNHDDVAKLTQGYLIRLVGVADTRVMQYRLSRSGGELLKDTPTPPDLAALQAENKRLRDALAWYADDDNHVLKPRGGYEYSKTNVEIDDGERARKALEGGE